MERRSFLRLLGSGGAAASALPTPVRGAVHAEPSRTPLEIGQERQLFLDDHVVETMEPRVFRLLNQPVRYRDNPVIPLGTDWEQKGGLSHGGDAGAVLYDPERKLYRFYGWMIAWPPLGSSVRKFIFYAESEDGLHWRKPPLGQVRYLGYDTNFIRLPFLGDASPGNLGVFRDPAARRPQERYKIVFQGKQDGAGGLYPGYSADGIRFHRYPVSRPIIPFYSDTNNNAIWNPGTNEYLVYHRTCPRLDPGRVRQHHRRGLADHAAPGLRGQPPPHQRHRPGPVRRRWLRHGQGGIAGRGDQPGPARIWPGRLPGLRRRQHQPHRELAWERRSRRSAREAGPRTFPGPPGQTVFLSIHTGAGLTLCP